MQIRLVAVVCYTLVEVYALKPVYDFIIVVIYDNVDTLQPPSKCGRKKVSTNDKTSAGKIVHNINLRTLLTGYLKQHNLQTLHLNLLILK